MIKIMNRIPATPAPVYIGWRFKSQPPCNQLSELPVGELLLRAAVVANGADCYRGGLGLGGAFLIFAHDALLGLLAGLCGPK